MAKAERGPAKQVDSSKAPDVGKSNRMAKADTEGGKSIGVGSSSVISRSKHGTRPFTGDLKRHEGKY